MDASRAERWQRLLVVLESSRGVGCRGFAAEQIAYLQSLGVAEEIWQLLAIGYPDSPVRIGTLTFFPSRELFSRSVSAPGRWPRLFFVKEAWENPRELERRLELDENGASELIDAAAEYLAATSLDDPFGREPRRGRADLRFWLPSVEHALEESVGQERTDRILTVLGGGVRWEDYREELDKRLMAARLWFLLGVLGVVYALARDGSLPGRLVMAGAAFGILGLGLGLAPWLRENARLRGFEE